MANKPVFSIITLAYKRLAYLKESLGAMFRQTYPNIEIVIVNNGAIPEVYDYITELARKDSRVKIVHFKENQYRDDDPGNLITVCFNAGLKAATGEFVWYQSDDDMIADDYVEKMAALFEGNPECSSAAGFFKLIDSAGRLLPEGPRTSNYRPRYMPGHLLALSTFNRITGNAGSIMFGAPGSIFAFRKEELVRAGGYHVLVEHSHLYGIVPFGVTGFDETAILYWRHHEEQIGKRFTSVGHTGLQETFLLIKDWQIEQRWQVFGKDTAKYVIQEIINNAYEDATVIFVINFYFLRFKACIRGFKGMWYRMYFWKRLPVLLWKEKRQFKYFMKPHIRRMFESWAWLARIPGLSGLKEKAFK